MKVPTYDAPQVGRTVARESQVSAAGDGKQMQALAGALGEAASDFDRIAAQQANEEAFTAEAQVKNAWIGHAAELHKSRQGANAKGVSQDVEKWWADNGPKFMEGKSGRAQRMIQQSLSRLQTNAVGEFKGFELRQGEVAADAALEANVKASVSAIASNPTPDNLALHRAGIAASLQQHAASRGWPPEVLNDKVATAVSASSIAAFNTLLARSPKEAREFWNLNRETVRGEQRDEIDNRLKSAVASMEGTEAVDAVWREMGPKSDIAPVELDKMATTIREKFKDQPEAQKAALQSLRERATEHNAAQTERAAGNTNEVMGVWNQTKNLAQMKRSPAWSLLPASQQAKIEDYVVTQQTAALNRSNAAMNRDLLIDQRNQQRLRLQGFAKYLELSDPRKLASMSDTQVQALLPDLGNELTGHLVEKRRALATSDATRTATIDKQDFDAIAQEMKLHPFETGASEERKAALGLMQYRVEQLIDTAQRQKKAPLDRQEKQAIMRNEMGKQVLVGNWYGGSESKPVISLTTEEVAKVKVPAPDRQAIGDAMRAMYERTKKPQFAPTEENLKRFYLLRQSPSAGLIPSAPNAQ